MSKASPKKIVDVAGVGSVEIRHSGRARRLRIQLKPFEPVQVVIPRGFSEKDALSLVGERRGWIQRHRQRMLQTEARQTIFTETTEFATRRHRLRIRRIREGALQGRISGEIAEVVCPAETPVESDEVQRFVRAVLEEVWRREAKQILPQRIDALAAANGLRYRRLFIKNMTSRWGSCSAKNNINLSLHLMRLPDRLVDYVILHELAHLEVKNHSPAYWAFLESLCPGARALDRELNAYQTRIY